MLPFLNDLITVGFVWIRQRPPLFHGRSFSKRIAEQPEGRRVDVFIFLFDAHRHIDGEWGGVRKCLEFFLALENCDLRQLALGDVLKHAKKSHDPTIHFFGVADGAYPQVIPFCGDKR